MEPPIAPGESLTFEVVGEMKPGGSKTARPLFRKDAANPGRVIAITTKTGMPIVNVSDDRVAKPWMSEVAGVAVQEWGPRDECALDEPLAVKLVFYFKRPDSHFGTGRNAGILKDSAPLYPATSGHDLDKLARSTLDAMTGIVYKNDRRIVKEPLDRRYGSAERCVVTIRRFRVLTVGELRRMRDSEPELAASLADQLAIAL